MRDLARTLTAADLSLLVVGTVIGSGILLVPGAVLRQTDGHAGLALCVWGVGAALGPAAATGTFEQLFTIVVFAGWAFYALGALAIFHYRRRHPGLPRPFRVPGYPWTPLLFVLSAGGIEASTFVTQPGRAFAGAAVVLAGAPAFWLWRRVSQREVQ